MPPALPPWPAPDAPAAAPAPTTRAPAAPPSRAGPLPSRAPAPPPSTSRPCGCSTARRRAAGPPAGAAACRAAPASGSSLSSRCAVAGRRARPGPRRCSGPAASRPTAPRTRSSRPPRPPRDPSPAARSPGRAGPSGRPPRRGTAPPAPPRSSVPPPPPRVRLPQAEAQPTGRVTPQEPSPNTSAGNRIRRQRGPVPFGKFATPDGSRFFRPVMRKVEEDGGGVVHRIELVFGEHLSGTVGNPDELQLMEAALRLSARFRAELLDRFRTAASPQDVLSAQRVLERIGRESYDEGFRDRDLMLQLFEGEERQQVNEMYDNWEKFRNLRGDGRLDQAFAKRDPTQLRTCVREIREMTRAFMISATRRYAEMVADWAF